MSDVPPGLKQCFRRNHSANQPVSQRFVSPEPTPCQQQLQSHRRPRVGRQRLRPAGGGNHTQLQLRHREHRVRRRNPHVGQQRNLHARTDAIPVHRRHNRLVQPDELPPNVPLPAHAPGNRLRRRRAELGEVGPRAKRTPLPGNQHRNRFRILGNGVQYLGKIIAHRRGKGVQLSRPVQRKVRHAAALLVNHGGEWSSHQSSAIARRIISSRSTSVLPAPISPSALASLTENVSRSYSSATRSTCAGRMCQSW